MIIVMGVSGCGKTTVGKLVSQKTNLPFFDADSFHSKANVEKMKNNIPLNDMDRKPWLESLSNKIEKWESDGGAILACSALKEEYRNFLSTKVKNINWVFLYGSFDVINARLEQRTEHYMKTNLLQSQFDTLEVPDYGLHISVENPLNDIVLRIISKFKLNE